MPIGLEQWRAQIGLLYASRTPRAIVSSKGCKYRRMKWSSLLSFCLELVDILLRTISDAIDAGKQVSRKAISWWKAQLSSSGVFQSLPTHSEGGKKGLSLLLICLMVVQMLLIMSGDVEENPGPLTRQESRLEINDLVTVQNELVNVAAKWHDIGLGLGFHPGKLHEIQQLGTDPSSCLQEMLDRWLKTVNPPPTWEGLAKALEREIVGEYRLAQQLRDKYCNPQQTEHDSQGQQSTKGTDGVVARASSPISGLVLRRGESLDGEISELQDTFLDLVVATADALKDVNLFRLKVYITQLPVSTSKYFHFKVVAGSAKVISNAKNVIEIFDVLKEYRYWNFLNCGVLEKIVKKFGSRDDRKNMKTYLEKLEIFCRHTKVRDFVIWARAGLQPHYYTDLTTTMEDEWMDRSLEELQRFQLGLSRHLLLDNYTLPIKNVKTGSLILFLSIHRSFPVDELVLLCQSESTRHFLRQHGVLRMELKGVCVFDLESPQTNLQAVKTANEALLIDSKQLQNESEDPNLEVALGNKEVKLESEQTLLQQTRNYKLQQKDMQISVLQKEIEDLKAVLNQKEAQLKSEQEDRSSEQHFKEYYQQRTKELEQQLQSQNDDIQQLKQELQQANQQAQEDRMIEAGLAALERTGGESIQLTWREGGRKAPRAMYRGAAAVEGSIAYFRPADSEEVLTYDSVKEEWSQLPECPHSLFRLAVVKGMVTAVGGRDSTMKDTNILLSLTGQGRDRKWVERFPPIPTKRCYTAVAYNGRNLIVAGGITEYQIVSTVEVMDTENLQWYTAASLPHPLNRTAATICGDKIYLLGGLDQDYSATKSVLTCSLTALIESCQPHSLGAQLRKSVWHTVADIPVYRSTCTTLRGELVAVGGHESDRKRTTAVYQYSPSTNSWQVISHMKTARVLCLVVAFPSNTLLVVGGFTQFSQQNVTTNEVEIATVF